MKTKQTAALLFTLALGMITSTARADASFVEDFDNNGSLTANGPANLVSQGWTFRNQSSSPVESAGWFDGTAFGQPAQAGTGCLYTASSFTVPFTGGHSLSNWAILPTIPNLAAGDTLSFFLFGNPPEFGDQKLQVRFSPGGGTATGSGASSVGDFSVMLGEFATNNVWTQIVVTIPGPGRIALRQWDALVSNFGGGVAMKIDTLAIQQNASSPCGIPLPQPGQTVTWTLAESPYVVCQNLTIPAGGIVNVEPGVTVEVQPGGPKLVIAGDLIGHATPQSPITLIGEDYSVINPPFEVRGGILDLQHANIQSRIQAKYGGTILASDCTIPASGAIAADPLQAQDPDAPTPQALTFRIERCNFTGGTLSAVSNVYLADSTFTGGQVRVAGYVYLNNVTVDGTPLEVEKDAGAQPMLIDHVTAIHNPASAGLKLSGANFHIGPNTVIQQNRWPVEFTVLAAGLTPDSVLPLTGNTSNQIYAGALDSGHQLTWPDLGLPYFVDRTVESAGLLTVMPGVTIKFAEFGGAIFNYRVRMTGAPGNPITLESANPGQLWNGIEFLQVAEQLVQNVSVRKARFALGSDESEVTAIDCVLAENDVAGTANTTGRWIARNCRFENNSVGLQTGSTFNAGSFDASGWLMPNSFTGNDLAVSINDPFPGNPSEAKNSWWGDSTGPTHPLNPGGIGDTANIPIEAITPFLPDPPVYTNSAPIVELEPGPGIAHAGDRIIIRWSVADDGPIAAQRIEYSSAVAGVAFNTIATLGANERTWEYDVQIVPPSNLNSPAGLRVVAVDDAGNESWDLVQFWVPYQNDWTVPDIHVPSPSGDLRPGDFFPVSWAPGATASIFVEIGSESTLARIPAGGGNGASVINKRTPYVSTDLARIMVQFTFGAGGREEYYFSDYFSVRPDSRIADDAPPTVALISPAAGQTFEGGSVVPIVWSASDDTGLREFDLQASYDGGVMWWSIARGLAPMTTNFNWRLPASNGIPDVRVRVIARDNRFQTTSAGGGVVFSITPGASSLFGDIDNDGDVDMQDVSAFIGALIGTNGDAGQIGRSDLNNDGAANGRDVQPMTHALIGP